jgi:hypothetical protein
MVELSKLGVLGGLEKVLHSFGVIAVPLGAGLLVLEAVSSYFIEWGVNSYITEDMFMDKVELVLPYLALIACGFVVGVANKYGIRKKLRVGMARRKEKSDMEIIKKSRINYISKLADFEGFIPKEAPTSKMIVEELHSPQNHSEKKIIPYTHASRKPSSKKKQPINKQMYYEEFYERNII